MNQNKETQNKVAVKQDNFLAPLQQKSAWGQAPALSPKDIIIPRILLMQGLSEKVTGGDAQFGDLRDSVSNDLLGGLKKPLDIIPFSMKKVIIVSEYNAKSKSYEYKEVLDATPETESLPYDQDGLKRQKVMSFFVLLPEEITKGGAIPKLISIKGTSMNAAKIIATQMYAINAAASPWLPPPAFVMTLSVKQDKNDKGTFAVLEAKRGRKVTEEELQLAYHWYESINANAAVKVDEHVDDPIDAATAKHPISELKDPENF